MNSIPVHHPDEEIPLFELVLVAKMASTQAQARAVIAQGGVAVNGNRIRDPHASITLTRDFEWQVGRRRFFLIDFSHLSDCSS